MSAKYTSRTEQLSTAVRQGRTARLHLRLGIGTTSDARAVIRGARAMSRLAALHPDAHVTGIGQLRFLNPRTVIGA